MGLCLDELILKLKNHKPTIINCVSFAIYSQLSVAIGSVLPVSINWGKNIGKNCINTEEI
jgi:hypothetical protein